MRRKAYLFPDTGNGVSQGTESKAEFTVSRVLQECHYGATYCADMLLALRHSSHYHPVLNTTQCSGCWALSCRPTSNYHEKRNSPKELSAMWWIHWRRGELLWKGMPRTFAYTELSPSSSTRMCWWWPRLHFCSFCVYFKSMICEVQRQRNQSYPTRYDWFLWWIITARCADGSQGVIRHLWAREQQHFKHEELHFDPSLEGSLLKRDKSDKTSARSPSLHYCLFFCFVVVVVVVV